MQRGRMRKSCAAARTSPTMKSHVARAAHAGVMCAHVCTHEGVGNDWQGEIVGAEAAWPLSSTVRVNSSLGRHYSSDES